jgi:hypothetical protein
MYTFIEGLPDNVLGIDAAGKITHEDYRDRLIPKAEAMMAKGPLKTLVVMRNDIGDYSLGALWDDQLFGLRHWRDVSHIAVVTDHAWVKTAATVFQPLFPAQMKIFPLAELDAAKAWITAI